MIYILSLFWNKELIKNCSLKKTADISVALGLHIWTNLTSLHVFAEFLHGYWLVHIVK